MKKHITVIGAGIVGIATASYLRRDGHRVTVIDRLPPGQYCSFGNAGILSPGSCVPQALPGVLSKVPGYLMDPLGPLSIRPAHFLKALPWFLRLLEASRLSRVEKIADALRPLLKHTFEAYAPLVSNANVSDLIRQTGYVVAYSTLEGYQADALAWKLRQDRGVLIQTLNSKEIQGKLPQLKGQFEIGLYLPEQGFVANPERLTQSLAQQFQADGGEILQREVLDIECNDSGPHSLLTDQGRWPVDQLVICAGSHSHIWAKKLGDVLPLEAERGYHVTYSDPHCSLPMPLFLPEQKVFVTPMEMGLRIAGQSEFAGNDAPPNYARADVLRQQMQNIFPGISAVDSTQWMGRRPSMPDSLPVIGPASKMAKVWYAFGHGHVGLCGGAPTGRLLADLIAGRRPNIDVRPFSPSRFR